MTIEVRRILERADLNAFIRFPFSLYDDSAYWVPPIIASEQKTLDPALNPAHQTSPAMLFMAFNNKKPVGRLAAIALQRKNGVEGRFGWFDVVNDQQVTRALFDNAEQWLREQGATQIKGPMGFTNLDRAGLLTFGFDELPTIATIYNHPYYNTHLEAMGFQKSVDYVEFEFKVPVAIPEKVTAFVDVIAKRYGVHILEDPLGKRIFEYGQQLFELINETHRNLYGFNLLSDEMKEYYIQKYLPFVKPDFVALVLNDEDKLVAYGLSMPSYSKAFQKARGHIFPFGFWHIRQATRHVDRVDLLLIGVADSMRNKGVTSLIFHKLLKTYMSYGVRFVESNPELEDNQQVQALWQKYEYRQHKRRRVYERNL